MESRVVPAVAGWYVGDEPVIAWELSSPTMGQVHPEMSKTRDPVGVWTRIGWYGGSAAEWKGEVRW